MIKPTVGRVVWYRNPEEMSEEGPRLAGLVAAVLADGLMVNLTVFDYFGVPRGHENVVMWQGEGDPPTREYCEWMPYQKGQAAKTEALEDRLASVEQGFTRP
jgi:hypothetical protein